MEKLKLAKFSSKNDMQLWWEAMGQVHGKDGAPMTYEVFKTEFEKYAPT